MSSSSVKDFPDIPARLQQRDDEIGSEMEAYERRNMQDPIWCAYHNASSSHVPDWRISYQYDEPPVGPLIEFEESCLQGRGDLLHLAVEMIRRK